MLPHNGSSVVLSGTDRVLHGEAIKTPMRRNTSNSSKTEATMVSLSTYASKDIKKGALYGVDKSSETLMCMAANEVMKSLKGRKVGAVISTEETIDLSTFDLASMLSEALDECRPLPMATTTNTTSSRASSVSSSNYSSEWNDKDDSDDGVNSEGADGACAADTALAAQGVSISEFLLRLNETAGSNNNTTNNNVEDGNGDASVASDITGLTGTFEDYPEGRRPKQVAALAEHIQQVVVSTPTIKSIVTSELKSQKRTISYSVRFDEVRVRSYTQIMSDNPACRKGPSLGLGWKYKEKVMDFEEWEIKRGRIRRPSELHMGRRHREIVVRMLGYSDKDVAAAIRSSSRIQYQRRQTITNLGSAKMEEAMETIRRRAKKMLFLGGAKMA